MSDSPTEEMGGCLVLIILAIMGVAGLYDNALSSNVMETHTIVASATDARFSGGKFRHKYQVEILVTRDENGQLHKIACPLDFWIEAKEGQTVLVKHSRSSLFDSFELNLNKKP